MIVIIDNSQYYLMELRKACSTSTKLAIDEARMMQLCVMINGAISVQAP